MRSEADRSHHGVLRHPVVHAAQQPPERHPIVARECERHPRGACHARHSAEELPDRGDYQDDRFSAHESSALLKIASDEPAPSLTACHVGRGERDRQQHEPADERRPEDGPPDALRRCCSRPPRVSSEVCAEASNPVIVYFVSRKPIGRTRNQKPMRGPREAGVVDALAEDEVRALVVSGTNTSIPMITATPTTCTPTDMLFRTAPGAVSEDVDQRVEEHDQEEQQPGLARMCSSVGEVHPEDLDAVESRVWRSGRSRAVGHRRHDADQADDVEPAGQPTPALAAKVVAHQ